MTDSEGTRNTQDGQAGGPGTNTGHGHVWPRPDGARARCGGAGLCGKCKADSALWQIAVTWTNSETGETRG